MISARILKEMAEQCSSYLIVIYKKYLSSGSIPEVWTTANVSAIFKKGERFQTINVPHSRLLAKLHHYEIINHIP
jgi:hypothetical protein